MDIAALVLASIAILHTESLAYNFECGYVIDGILVHEATPRYNQTWWGFATYDRIVIRKGLSSEERMMVFAHERKHYDRMHAGIFDNNNLENEERLAYEYGFNESNWNPRINNFKCIKENQ